MADKSFSFTGTIGDFERLTKGVDIKQELIDMAKNINDIGASVTELRAFIATEHQEVADALAKQQASIDELTALVAAAGSQEDIERVLAEVQSAKDEVSAIVTPTPAEPTEPDPNS